MAIQFTCPTCRRPYTVPDSFGGKQSTCKICGEPLEIPLRSAEPAAAAMRAVVAAPPAEPVAPPAAALYLTRPKHGAPPAEPLAAEPSPAPPSAFEFEAPPTPPPPLPVTSPHATPPPLTPPPVMPPPLPLAVPELALPHDRDGVFEDVVDLEEPGWELGTANETLEVPSPEETDIPVMPAATSPRPAPVRDLPPTTPPPALSQPRYRTRNVEARAPLPTLSDGAADMVCLVLLLVLIGGGAWLSHKFVDVMGEQVGLPAELQSRFYTYLGLIGLWALLLFAIVFVPVVLVTAALAANWTRSDLPERAYLRAAGTCTLPYLLIGAVVTTAMQHRFTLAVSLAITAPFLLLVALKELMALRWNATLITAILLLVFLPVLSLLLRPVTAPVPKWLARASGVDEGSVQQWMREHPDEMKASALRSKMFARPPGVNPDGSVSNPSAAPAPPAPPPSSPDDSIFAEPPAATTRLSHALAMAAADKPPAEVFKPIDDRPIPGAAAASDADYLKETFAFKTVRFRPPAGSRVDLFDFAPPAVSQRWFLNDDGSVTLRVQPAHNPSQQRPWVFDKEGVVTLATGDLFVMIITPPPEKAYGRLGAMLWTRLILNPDDGSSGGFVQYVARAGDKWLVVEVRSRRANVVALGDKFVQAVHVAQPGEPPAADPFEPERIVDRFDNGDDPGPALTAAGERGRAALAKYLQRRGDKAPAAAKSLFDSLGPWKLPPLARPGRSRPTAPRRPAPAPAGPALPSPAPPVGGPAPVKPAAPAPPTAPTDALSAAVQTLRTGTVFEKRDAIKRLAAMKPDDDRRDEVAAALEPLVTGDQSFILAADAADALKVWWRPQTVVELLPLLDEHTFPPQKRQAAMTALSATHDRRAVMPLLRWIIKDPEATVAALQAIGPVAEDDVVRLLREKDPHLRASAARILQAIGTQKCLIELRRAANDPRDPAAAATARAAVDLVLERVKAGKSKSPAGAATRPAVQASIASP